ECLHSPICGVEGVFVWPEKFWTPARRLYPALVSQSVNRSHCMNKKLRNQRMFHSKLLVLALAGVCIEVSVSAQYASSVVSYVPGIGFAAGYTNPAAALGEPPRITPGTFGGPVDPFDPPYLRSQLVSLGAGGSLTVKFSTPVLNHPLNRFGIDLIIFGNAFFVVTNAIDPVTFEYIGTPATDGSIFGNAAGATRVSVSRDGDLFYEL